MINFVLFTSVFVVYYAIECMIEHFIFGSTNTNYTRAIQAEQRKLLETHRIVKELEAKLEAVFPPTQQKDHHATTTEYHQDRIYHTVSYSTSLVIYSPPVEAAPFIPCVYIGSLVALFVLVFIFKWFTKTDRKENKTSDESESDVVENCVEDLKELIDNDVFEDCVEELFKESSVTDTDVFEKWFDACTELKDDIDTDTEWFDACTELSDVIDTDTEWFDACTELRDVIETDEDWFDACVELSDAIETDAFAEECVDEPEKELSDLRDTAVFIVSNEVSSADESEGVLIAFGDFTLGQTKDFMETSGFVLTLPEKNNENPSSTYENQSKKDPKHQVKADEPSMVFKFDMDDNTNDDTMLFGRFSLEELEESQRLQTIKQSETIVSNPEKENQPTIETKVEENKDENKKENESGIAIFKTDLQISQSTNTAPSCRQLQTWEPARDDEVADLECLEKEDEDLKDETILSPEEMYRLNPNVQSTFLEDLSQYSTELDVSSLSREAIEFAEKMANEIMKENKQRKNKQRRRNSKRNRNY